MSTSHDGHRLWQVFTRGEVDALILSFVQATDGSSKLSRTDMYFLGDYNDYITHLMSQQTPKPAPCC